MNKEQEDKLKKFSIGIIVLCILFFALVTCGDDSDSKNNPKQTDVDKALQEKRKAAVTADKEARRDRISQESERLVTCQITIKNQLKTPKSFDAVFSTVEHAPDLEAGGHVVGFDFYAKNSFNAEIIHQAACSFDASGNLTKALFAPK